MNKRKLERKTGFWGKQKHEVHWWKYPIRRPRKDILKEETKQKVTEFYLSGEVSRCLPSKKDVSKRDNEPKVRDADYN